MAGVRVVSDQDDIILVESGGVVRDPLVRQEALHRVERDMCDAGFTIGGSCTSPIRGRKGNEEYLLLGTLG